MYSKLAVKTPEQHLVLLLLILNIYLEYIHNLFYCYCWIQINAAWAWKTLVSDNEFVFGNCEKYSDQGVGKICRATCFHLYSPNLRFQKDKFSQQCFKKISQTLSKLLKNHNQNLKLVFWWWADKWNNHVNSFPYENCCECYKKLASRLWPGLFTHFNFFLTHTLPFCRKIKSCCGRCFPQQIRPQTTVQWYILPEYSSVRIGFNMINKQTPCTACSLYHVS